MGYFNWAFDMTDHLQSVTPPYSDVRSFRQYIELYFYLGALPALSWVSIKQKLTLYVAYPALHFYARSIRKQDIEMDISALSTEALEAELRRRQARPVIPAGLRQSDSGVLSDDDSLFVSEIQPSATKENISQAKESSGRNIARMKRLRRASSRSEESAKRARRETTSRKIQNSSNDLSNDRDDTASAQEENDRLIAVSLQAEEDALLVESEVESDYARIGTKNPPVDLDRNIQFFKAPSGSFDRTGRGYVGHAAARQDPQGLLFDSAMARQLHKEEIQAQEQRLRAVASLTRDCVVCGSATLITNCPSLPLCTHEEQVCSDCYAAWIASQLEDTGWQEAKCPGTTCNITLTYEEIKAYASNDIFTRYDVLQARNALSSNPDFRWCRAEGCVSGQIHETEEVGNVFICVECHASFCTVHEGAHHEDETCEDFEYRTSRQKERDERKKQEDASEEAVGKLAKKCPNRSCRAPIQKNGGCNHITCRSVYLRALRLHTDICRLEVSATFLLCLLGQQLAKMRPFVCGRIRLLMCP